MKLLRGVCRVIGLLITAISFALFVVICAVWVRSAFAADAYPVLTRDRTLVYPMSMNNRLQLLVMREWRDPVPPAYHGSWSGFRDWGRYGAMQPRPGEPGRPRRQWRYPVVDVSSGDMPGWEVAPNRQVIDYRMPIWVVQVEYYLPALITGFLPGVAAFAWTRRALTERRRRQFGRCKSCGYDLRASAVRCPECGETIPDGTPRLTERSNA